MILDANNAARSSKWSHPSTGEKTFVAPSAEVAILASCLPVCNLPGPGRPDPLPLAAGVLLARALALVELDKESLPGGQLVIGFCLMHPLV